MPSATRSAASATAPASSDGALRSEHRRKPVLHHGWIRSPSGRDLWRDRAGTVGMDVGHPGRQGDRIRRIRAPDPCAVATWPRAGTLLSGALAPARAALAQVDYFGQNKKDPVPRLRVAGAQEPAHRTLLYPRLTSWRTSRCSYAEQSVAFLEKSSATRRPPRIRSSSTRRTPTSSRPTCCRLCRPEGCLASRSFSSGGDAPVHGQLRRLPSHAAPRTGARLPAELLTETYDGTHDRVTRRSLWWTEGLRSSGRVARTDGNEMILRDLTIAGRIPPCRISTTSRAASSTRWAARCTNGSPAATVNGASR